MKRDSTRDSKPSLALTQALRDDAGGDVFPASYAQQRLWLHEQLLPVRGVYNVAQVLRLGGDLDVAALSRALVEVVSRHESLRTHFVQEDGTPMQVVSPSCPVELEVEAVDGSTAEARSAAAFSKAHAEANAGFDLARGPLWRARLYRLDPQEHWLQLTLHHIITDGWSMGVLTRELSQSYAAHCAGTASPLAPLPVQYADYAVWQRQWLQGEVLASHLAYWRKALSNLPVLELPTDRRRSSVPNYRGGRVPFALSADLTRAVKALSRREGATLFMTLLAAFQVLLFRLSGQEDVVIGAPIAGRSRPEVEDLIGFFVNMLVLRGDLRGAPGFTRYLARIRERALEAYAHQDVPFEKLVEDLAPERDLSRHPLFQVSLVLHNTPQAEWRLPGLTASRVEGVTLAHTKFDLTVSLTERSGALAGSFDYASALFEEATISRFARHFRVLLEAIVATPEMSIARLPLLEPDERAQLLARGRGPEGLLPASSCVHEAFVAQVARTPDAKAVVQGTQSFTYRELDTRANQLAHRLRALGVAADVPVALCLPRSLDLIVAMLAVLKAGGAYVPLDPDYPAERAALMLADAKPPALVTQRSQLAALPPFDGHLLCIDRDAKELATQPIDAPVCDATPAHLAYIIYTSGSTGRPKGVMVTHDSVVGLACKQNFVAISADDTIGHVSNVAFDAATFEVWGALLNGACLAILAREDVLSAPAFVRSVEREGITCMFLTTSLFNAIAAENPHAFRGLRSLLFGGEAHDPSRVGEVMRATPPGRLVNGYGPTETTTFATFHEVRPEEAGSEIPIGRPLCGAEIVIVDARGELVPQGVVGEICIGGRGVARGYLGLPSETAERFVAHPANPDRRVFKTGDLGRWNAAGAIEYLGRNDEQVKIRGFRIEPAEVAAAVRSHPSVRACHVMARKQASGDMGLTAYFVTTGDEPRLTVRALHEHVASRLPSFMVPASFVEVDALPLTENGKLDQRALPDPATSVTAPVTSYVAPRDEIERALCAIWAQALGVEQVGIDDNFFDLGGHSLLAARIFSRIDADLGCSLPLGVLFEASTVRELAQRVRDARSPDFTSLVVMSRGGPLPALYMVPGVLGNLVGFAPLVRALGPDQPVYGLQSIGLDGVREPLASITAIAEHCLQEIRVVQPHGPYAFAGACFGATVAYEIARQAMAQGETVAFLGLLDPSNVEGEDNPNSRGMPNAVRRVLAIARLAVDRVALYGAEMETLRGTDRLRYALRKLGRLLHRVRSPSVGDLRREIGAREVYRCNVAALRCYERLPLHGDLRVMSIIETARGRELRDPEEWSRWWSGETVRDLVPGKDSGEMISQANVEHVALAMSARLREAFAVDQLRGNAERSREASVAA
ncbi:MAG TPA: amino acid adenylation domain-containing protein [Casimicrobiaceae bacterium]|nr:amino acid adenylation domain-containing protein [Casimicrobiaceae bacterium]